MEAQVGTGMDSCKFGRGECLPDKLVESVMELDEVLVGPYVGA